MSIRDATIAERQRGCVFAENFESAASIAANGGVITGTLQYSSEKGAYFDGTDYVTYAVREQPFLTGIYSFEFEFIPTATPNSWYVFNGGSTVNLRLYSNNFYFVPYTGQDSTLTFPAWALKLNQRNVFGMIVQNTSYYGWLNGVQTSVGLYTVVPQGITSLAIGSGFTGWIKSMRFFSHPATSQLLTQQEVSDYTTNTTYSYPQKCSCWFDMDAASLRVNATTGEKALVSKYGKSPIALLGDGTTANTQPTKLAKKGYYHAGVYGSYGPYYTIKNATTAFNSSSGFTVAQQLSFNNDEENMNTMFWQNSGGSTMTRSYIFPSAPSSPIVSVTYNGVECYYRSLKAYHKEKVPTVWVWVVSIGSNGYPTTRIYVDGSYDSWTYPGVVSAPSYTNAHTINPFQGQFYNHIGNVYHMSVYSFPLTHTQVLDLTNRLKNQPNRY